MNSCGDLLTRFSGVLSIHNPELLVSAKSLWLLKKARLSWSGPDIPCSCCSGCPAQWKGSPASTERNRLHLQDLCRQMSVWLGQLAFVWLCYQGPELHLGGPLLSLGHPRGFLPACIIHGTHQFCLWVHCRCTQHTQYPFQMKGNEEKLRLVIRLGSGQCRFCVSFE